MRLAASLSLVLLVAACAEEAKPPKAPEAPALSLTPVAFADLPGWGEDDAAGALAAFRLSCDRWSRLPDDRSVGGQDGFAGTVAAWRDVCEAAAEASDARGFFADRFAPFAVADRGEAEGLFTGYFEPVLDGSRAPDQVHRYPIYRRPPDLVSVDLGRFDPELEGRRIAGRVEDGRLVPYADRAAIDAGALTGRGLELFWVDDPIDRFFLEIQGSGQVRLREGGVARLGYADQNGHPYHAIGRDLIAEGAIPREQMSMQAIRAWLETHPERAPELMQRNRSYVFFTELVDLATASGPLGAMGVPLTPGRSLAIDRKFLPLGAPMWLDTTAPEPEGERQLRRLMVAQDTGGAIRGPVRGDVFWGAGPRAAHLAGHMKSPGRLFILLPRNLAPVG